MRFSITCTAALLLPVLLQAQDRAQKQSPAKAVVEKLTAELNKQNREYRAARSEITASDAYKQARKDKDRAAINALMKKAKRPDLAGLGQQAMSAAAGMKGDDRVLLLGWAAIKSRDKDIITKVVDEISNKHIESPAILELLENARSLSRPLGADASKQFLNKVIADSPHAQPRAYAMYWLSKSMAGRGASAGDKEKAGELLASAEELAKGTALGDRIAGPRFVKERLQIGMEAPDIAGQDVDGVDFKLSDYRGKVVVIDFWGFW